MPTAPLPPPIRGIHPVELTLLLTSFIAATYAFGIYLFASLLPDMRTTLTLRYSEIGWITGLAQIGFLLGALASAGLVSWLGATRLMLASVFTCCLCLALMPLMHTAAQLVVPMAVAGCAAATVWVPMVRVVQAHIAVRHQGKMLGLISSGTAYGLFLNGFSVPVLIPLGGWQSVWLFSAALTLVLWVWGLRLPADAPKAVQSQSTPSPIDPSADNHTTNWRTVLRDPVSRLVLLLMFLNGLACMPTMNYLMSFLREEVGYSVEAAGRVWSTIGFVGMLGGFAMGALADRISIARALVVTYVFLAAATALFLQHGGLAPVQLGAALFGLAFNALFGLIPALVSQSFSAQQATAVFAVSNFMLGIGSMLGNLLGGVVREQAQSFQQVYLACFAVNLLLVGLSVYLQQIGKRRIPRQLTVAKAAIR